MEFKDNKSIALQIADNLSEKILQGNMPVEERIPSVRELAAEMGVNPNTIMRSYAELQSKDIISNQRGIGYFVNKNAKKTILEGRRNEFFANALPELVHQMNLLNISYDELKASINALQNNHTGKAGAN